MRTVSNRILHLLLVWGLLLLPVQPALFAADPEPDINTVIEVTDSSSFCKDLMKLPALKGYASEEMKEFSGPIKAQLNKTFESLKAKFGIDVNAVQELISGRIQLHINTKAQSVVIYAEPGKNVDISSNINVLKKIFQKERIKTDERTVSGSTVLSVRESGTVVSFIYNEKKVVFSVSQMDISVKLVSAYMMGDVPRFNDGAMILQNYPDVKGDGVCVYSNSQLPEFPIPGMNVKAMLDTLNFPGMAESASRVFVKDDRLCSIAFTKQNMKLGLSSMLLPGPVSKETLSWAHESCITAAGMHVKLDAFPKVVADVISASGSQQLVQNYNMILPQVKMMTGLDIENDLFGSLGDEVLFISFPGRTGGGFPVLSLLGLNSLVCVVKLKNQANFEKTSQVLGMLLGNAAQMDRVQGGLRTIDHNGTSIQYIKAFGGVLSPCVAVKDGYAVFGMNVPIMRFVLDSKGKADVTQTAEFKKTLEETGSTLSSGFVYQRGISDEEGAMGQNFTNPLLGIWLSSVFAGALMPTMARARGAARSAACKNNLRQIGVACAMHSMSHDEKYPDKLMDLMPDTISDKRIFQCHSAPQSGMSYVYLPGHTSNSSSNAILAFDHKGNHPDGRNVLFVDAHVEFMSEAQFQMALTDMPERQDRPMYSQDALKIIQLVIADELPAPVGAAPGRAVRNDPLFDQDAWRDFVKTEAMKIAASIDFALFPRGEVFPGGRKSNITSVMIKDDGMYSKGFTGHMLRPGNGASTLPVYVAVVAVVAAIAIPSLIKSKISANEGAAAGTLKTMNGMLAVYKKKGYAGLGKRYPIGNDPAVPNSGKFCGLYYEVNNAEDMVTLIGAAEAAADWRSSEDPFAFEGNYTPSVNITEHKMLQTVTFERRPKQGYWFALMKYYTDADGNKVPYDKNAARNHYALVAWPADYGETGENTYIINEEGIVWMLDRGVGEYVDTYPGPTPADEFWEIAE